MTKHDTLTDEEFSTFKPPARSIAQLYEFMASRGGKEKDIRVLDWGCGRGRFVLWLREKGFEAYGVDIDQEPIENGMGLIKSRGYQSDVLSVISPTGKTNFPDGYFDFIITGNVFEHVHEIDGVISEIGRLTAPGGGGYHIFPAQRQIVEGHLFMPFVHWIPAGSFRKSLIGLLVRLGQEPGWKELKGCSAAQKTETYYKYSTDNIFYRPFSVFQKLFNAQGFRITYLTIDNPEISRKKVIRPFVRTRLFRPILAWALLTFFQVEFKLQKMGQNV